MNRLTDGTLANYRWWMGRRTLGIAHNGWRATLARLHFFTAPQPLSNKNGDYATSPRHWAVAAAKRNAKKEKRKTHPELYARLWFRQPPPAAGSRRILVSGGTKTRTRPDVCGRAPTRRTVHRIRRRSSETTTGRNRIGHVAPSLRPAILEKGRRQRQFGAGIPAR